MSNVLLTGNVPLPMMKQAGYPPAMAGAVEAVAPPAARLCPRHGQRRLHHCRNPGRALRQGGPGRLIPAVLFYLATFVQVHMEAGKLHLKIIHRAQLPKPMEAIKHGWFIIPPIAVLLICMFSIGLPAALSALIAGVVVLPCLALKQENRVHFLK